MRCKKDRTPWLSFINPFLLCSKKHSRSEPPVFLKKIGDCDIYEGMIAKFTACATGYPEPEVEWFKNDQKLFPSNRFLIDIEPNGLLRLTIKNVTEDDVGRYSCRIFNPYGEDICHAELFYDCGSFEIIF